MEDPKIIIRIPEPCHEDWNKMLPDEKGKFCNSCNKSVVDFSNKTDTQIKDILMANQDQRVCGHFKKSQIDRPLNIRIDLNNLPKNMSITKMFMVALFISFGTLLFSCTDNLGKAVGEISVVEPIKNKPEEIEKMTMTGEVAMPPDTLIQLEKLESTVDGQMEIMTHYESHVAGGISIQQVYPQEIINEKIMPKDSILIDSQLVDIPKPEEMMVGMMIFHVPEIVNEEPQKVDSLVNNNVIEKIDATDITITNDITSDFIVFPNPTKGEFTLKYDVKKRSDVFATIIDIKGVTVRTIVNTAGQHTGKYQVPVDLSDLINGIYFVNLTVEGKRRTQKVILQK
jgi:hypothetical protein